MTETAQLQHNNLHFTSNGSDDYFRMLPSSGAVTFQGISNGDLCGLEGIADPAGATSATNKQYVDSLVSSSISGMAWKASVRCASTTNVALATGVADGSTMDGVTLATGDRVLLKDQNGKKENGISLEEPGAWNGWSYKSKIPG